MEIQISFDISKEIFVLKKPDTEVRFYYFFTSIISFEAKRMENESITSFHT